MLVNLALDSVGMPCDLALMERDLDEIDSWYVGNGWYTDGDPAVKPQRDYYIPWALQILRRIVQRLLRPGARPARAARFRQRALEFGREFAFWFDENGAALPYGRSLGYRFGQCAFYAACVFAGLEPLPLPVMKGIIVRNFQWWLAKPILDRDGVLTIGYCYPQLYMSERYNSPGSPYWGMKSLLVLALPQDHPFWAAEAAPLPKLPALYAMQSADLLFQRLPDGQVNAYAPAEVEENEHGQFAEKYGKFVYSTRFGFSASRSYAQLEQAAPDSMLAFVIGGQVFVRRHSERFQLLGDRLLSQWVAVPRHFGHDRARAPGAGAISAATPCKAPSPAQRMTAALLCPNSARALPLRPPARWPKRTTTRFPARSRPCRTARALVLDAWPNTSLYTPNTVIPAVRYVIPAGVCKLATRVESASR